MNELTPNTGQTFEEQLDEILPMRYAEENLSLARTEILACHEADKQRAVEEAIKGKFYSKVEFIEGAHIPAELRKSVEQAAVRTALEGLERCVWQAQSGDGVIEVINASDLHEAIADLDQTTEGTEA